MSTGGIRIPVEAQLDAGDLARTIQQFTEQVNRMGHVVAQANKVKFNPVDKASLDDLRKMTAQFESLLKISGGLKDRMRATGQGGAGFTGVDWSRLYDDPNMRGSRMGKAFEYVTAGTAWGGRISMPPPAPPPGGSGGGNVVPMPPGRGGGGAGGFARPIIGAGLNAMGGAGQVANGALSAGLSGGALAGVMGLVGGLAALGIGKVVSAVMDKLGNAQQEAIGYDTLKRSLGDVNVSFSLLQSSIRANADALHISYDQALKMGTEFAKLSGMTADQSKALADEMKVGAGFGRASGVDPEQSNRFFAAMRQSQVTHDANDSRRLALMIGEAVGKSGQFSKMDEVLQSLSSFVAQQTRNGMVSANATGYLGAFGSLMGKAPGLDAAGTAGMLGTINGAIQNPRSEAMQNFMFRHVGRRLGLDPVQMMEMQEGGAFATGKSTFGEGSVEAAFRAKFGGKSPSGAIGDTTSMLQMVMDGMKKDYGNNPNLMLDAMGQLGLNHSKAKAFATYYDSASLGRIQDRLGPDFDMRKLNATSPIALARIDQASRPGLDAQAASLSSRTGPGALTAEETKALKNAQAQGTEELRRILTQLTATRDMEQTDGDKTRASITDASNIAQKAASELIGPTNMIRDAAVALAKKFVGDDYNKTPEQIAKEKALNDEVAARRARAPGMLDALKNATGIDLSSSGRTEEGAWGAIKQRESGGHQFYPADDKYGHKKGDLILGDPTKSGSRAIGISQILPEYGPDFARDAGMKWDENKARTDPVYNEQIGKGHFMAMVKRMGLEKAIAAYHAGETTVKNAVADHPLDWQNHIGPKSGDYVHSVYGTAMPAGAAPGGGWGGETSAHNINVGVQLYDKNGAPAAAPIQVQHKINAPMAQGSR